MQQKKKYWELSQESTTSQHLVSYLKRVNSKTTTVPPPVADSQEAPAVIQM
jgi:hypothetical protein